MIKNKTYDIFSYNGEEDILEIRLNTLDKFVDKFIIVEAPTTFSGDIKPLYFPQQSKRFEKWTHKIHYYVVKEKYTLEEFSEAYHSKYTGGAMRWIREFLQKEALQKVLIGLDDEDTCYIGDVDEIWEPRECNGIEKLRLRVYTYYLNMRSSEEFSGPIRAKYKDIKGKCLNNIRNDQSLSTKDYQGWHFTSQGGLDALNKKILDQYNPELFNEDLRKRLPSVFGQSDFIGRPFTFQVEESAWPEYLKQNREKYQNLIKKLD